MQLQLTEFGVLYTIFFSKPSRKPPLSLFIHGAEVRLKLDPPHIYYVNVGTYHHNTCNSYVPAKLKVVINYVHAHP